MGTAAYMSPEQAIGAPVDHRSDLFSLGVLLYEAATGRPPFAGATWLETLDRIRHHEPEPPSRLNADVSGDLDRVIGTCLAKAPSRRYQSAGELLSDLRLLARQSDPPVVRAPDRPAHNLAADLTSFVGRRAEVDHLVGLLGDARLVTLTGWRR
jgi:serine/threonine protein kinase